MAWLVIGLGAVVVIATCVHERRVEEKHRIHTGNLWLHWRSQMDPDALAPLYHHHGPWNISKDDRGPSGRKDMTPGGRR